MLHEHLDRRIDEHAQAIGDITPQLAVPALQRFLKEIALPPGEKRPPIDPDFPGSQNEASTDRKQLDRRMLLFVETRGVWLRRFFLHGIFWEVLGCLRLRWLRKNFANRLFVQER